MALKFPSNQNEAFEYDDIRGDNFFIDNHNLIDIKHANSNIPKISIKLNEQ